MSCGRAIIATGVFSLRSKNSQFATAKGVRVRLVPGKRNPISKARESFPWTPRTGIERR